MDPRPLREHSLREHSLRGARLSAASLAGADLRGTNFTGADLHDADLSRIRSGMSRGWGTLVVAGSLACSIGIGLVAGICMRELRMLHADPNLRMRTAAWFITTMLLAFLVVGI